MSSLYIGFKLKKVLKLVLYWTVSHLANINVKRVYVHVGFKLQKVIKPVLYWTVSQFANL